MSRYSIFLEPQVAFELEHIANQTKGLEFSGLGFATRKGNVIKVYDHVLLHVGSETFTQIDPLKIMALSEREDAGNLRVWYHRHPMGGPLPGPANWSGTDEKTIATTPLGGVPELVGWSVSIVRTIAGVWVGRIDNHRTGKTEHLPVFPQVREGVSGSLAELNRRSKPLLLSGVGKAEQTQLWSFPLDDDEDRLLSEDEWEDERYGLLADLEDDEPDFFETARRLGRTVLRRLSR